MCGCKGRLRVKNFGNALSVDGSDFPKSEEFLTTLGQITWLLSVDSNFQSQSISFLRSNVLAPIKLKQVRIFTKGKAPVAALSWAYASPAVAKKIHERENSIDLPDWRSGDTIVLVDRISPFGPIEPFEKLFFQNLSSDGK